MKVLGYDISFKKIAEIQNKENSKPKAGRSNPAIVKIVQNFKDNSRKDIDKWRKALQLAAHPEEPKLTLFYDLLEDLLTDGHLQSQIQMRKMSTLNTDFQVINRKTAEIDEENTFLLQQQWFYDFLNHCLDSLLFGVTLVEFRHFENEKVNINLIPRRNVVPALGKILPDATKDDFINYKDDVFKAWLLEIGKAGDLGILNNIIPNLIWKRNVLQSWAEFCEKFGMPLITATTNSQDTEKVDEINELLLSLGEATVGTFPFGTDIK
ncbi:phage portal protein family protein, partial [Capnocytophaga canis]